MKYHVYWDNGDCVDGFDAKSREDAIASAKEFYEGWIAAARLEMYSVDDWNFMVGECLAEVCEVDDDYNGENGWLDYGINEPTDEWLKSIGWIELDEGCKYTLKDIADHDITSWVEGISLMSDDEKTIDEAIAMYGDPYDKELDCPAELEVELTAIANRDGWRFSIDGMKAVTNDGRSFSHAD